MCVSAIQRRGSASPRAAQTGTLAAAEKFAEVGAEVDAKEDADGDSNKDSKRDADEEAVMLIVLSPAKALDYETPAVIADHTEPRFLDDSETLIKLLKKLTPAKVSELMDLSDKLSALNVARYAAWSRPMTTEHAKQAVLAFDGDVYAGLQAPTLDRDGLLYAQQHVRILSGLYGVLRPLDLMAPYRLEMGTQLPTRRGKNLYEFWGDRLAKSLVDELKAHTVPVLVNLASEEYFKAVRRPSLKARVVSPVFQEGRNGSYKIISFMAKKARGTMTRWIIDERIDDPARLVAFDRDGYQYVAAASKPDAPVFRRDA